MLKIDTSQQLPTFITAHIPFFDTAFPLSLDLFSVDFFTQQPFLMRINQAWQAHLRYYLIAITEIDAKTQKQYYIYDATAFKNYLCTAKKEGQKLICPQTKQAIEKTHYFALDYFASNFWENCSSCLKEKESVRAASFCYFQPEAYASESSSPRHGSLHLAIEACTIPANAEEKVNVIKNQQLIVEALKKTLHEHSLLIEVAKADLLFPKNHLKNPIIIQCDKEYFIKYLELREEKIRQDIHLWTFKLNAQTNNASTIQYINKNYLTGST